MFGIRFSYDLFVFQDMYQTFQQDLVRLKLLTGKEFLQSVQSGLNPVAKTKTDAIRINAEVHGLGPRFKLTVKLQNTSTTSLTPIIDLFISFTYDENIYNLNSNYIQVFFFVLKRNDKMLRLFLDSDFNQWNRIRILYICNLYNR